MKTFVALVTIIVLVIAAITYVTLKVLELKAVLDKHNTKKKV